MFYECKLSVNTTKTCTCTIKVGQNKMFEPRQVIIDLFIVKLCRVQVVSLIITHVHTSALISKLFQKLGILTCKYLKCHSRVASYLSKPF